MNECARDAVSALPELSQAPHIGGHDRTIDPLIDMGVGARLLARWYLVVIAVIVAVLVTGASLFRIGSGGLVEKKTEYDVGSAQLLVDTDPSALASVSGVSAALGSRAPYIAEYGTSPSVVASIARAAGHPVRVQAAVKSAALGFATNSPGVHVSTGSGNESVVLQATAAAPTIQVSTQAGTLTAAHTLAVATVRSLRQSLRTLQKTQGVASPTTSKSAQSSTAPSSATSSGQGTASLKIVLRTLGAITATQVASSPKKSKAILYGVAALIVLLLVILALDSVFRNRRQAREPASADSLRN